MDLNQQKEQFSVAYLRAVTAVAGYNLRKPDVDEDSIDWGIAASDATALPRSPRLELQLKCSSQRFLHEENVHFPLKLKNYNDLRKTFLVVPRLLVVVLIPPDLQNWILQTEEEMAMRHCGYWQSLRGQPEVENESSVTVNLSRSQRLTPEALHAIMKRVDNEEEL